MRIPWYRMSKISNVESDNFPRHFRWREIGKRFWKLAFLTDIALKNINFHTTDVLKLAKSECIAFFLVKLHLSINLRFVIQVKMDFLF